VTLWASRAVCIHVRFSCARSALYSCVRPYWSLSQACDLSCFTVLAGLLHWLRAMQVRCSCAVPLPAAVGMLGIGTQLLVLIIHV
jgi:hypothetical protein